MFTKRQPGYRGGYWGVSLSGNCWNSSISQINYSTKVYLSPNLEDLEQTRSWSWMDRLKVVHKFTAKIFEEAFYFLDQFLVSGSLGHRVA